MTRYLLVIAIAITSIAIIIVMTVMSVAAPPSVVIAEGAGEACVEPVETMRRQHMDFLLHQRDVTVHQGIREQRHSLIGCVDCHTAKDSNGEYISINAEGQFCQSCHVYSAVKIDCFECHATVPAQ